MAIELLRFHKGIPITDTDVLDYGALFTNHRGRLLQLRGGVHQITPAPLCDGPFRHFISIFPDGSAVYAIVHNEPNVVRFFHGQPTVKYFGPWQFLRLPKDVEAVAIASDFSENGVARIYAALRYRAQSSRFLGSFFRE